MWLGAEIAVAMAVPIENPTDCEVRDVIRFLQAHGISGYHAEETCRNPIDTVLNGTWLSEILTRQRWARSANVTIKFFLANTTSCLQPLDQGVIRSFKVNY